MGRNRLLLMLQVLLISLLTGCGGEDGENRDVGFGQSRPDLSDIEVYAADSPYADVLKGCVSSPENLCSFETLPLVGHEVARPDVEDIMDRVLVSDQWMGDRFRQVLEHLPVDVLLLMKGTTAIVIDGDIRPSFHSGDTAAIYLDPKDLWLTADEKATVSPAADYRNGYGSGLAFMPLWRYVKEDEYAYNGNSLTGTESRQLDDILFPMARLLYHELAHANDTFPPGRIADLDLQWTAREAAQALDAESVAAGLGDYFPLSSEIWSKLARVLYFGDPLSGDLIELAAGTAGDEFAADAANAAYGYATPREDVAMLFEETMMKFHFDIDRDFALATVSKGDADTCSDYLVQWGVRNRIGDGMVRQRAAYVVSHLLPDRDLSDFWAALPEPTMMAVDRDWCENLILDPGTPQAQGILDRVRIRFPARDRLPPQ